MLSAGMEAVGKILYLLFGNFRRRFSLIYAIVEQFPPLWPQLAQMPLVASLLGAVFVGVGAGLCVRAGGAPRRR